MTKEQAELEPAEVAPVDDRARKTVLVAVTVEANNAHELPDDVVVVDYVKGSVVGDLLVGPGQRYVFVDVAAP